MLTLTKSLLALMLGFIGATLFGLIAIPFLKKLKAGQRINVYVEAHKGKAGTPTMGGIIFIIPTFLIMLFLLITGKIAYSVNLVIVLFVFLSYALIGFLDDFISLKRKANKGLSQTQKLFLQLIVALVFYILFRQFTDGDSYLRISALGIEWNLGWFYGVFILFVLVGSSNAVNLTDGLDGLAGGLSTIAFIAFALISFVVGFEDIGIFCLVLAGAVMGFLFFNINPAKVFMGDTGSLALGAVMGSIAILTHRELTLVVVAGVFIIETLTVILQTLSMVLFHKKLFLMTPLHHHFEKLGWDEQDIVKAFWVVGLIFAMSGIIFGVWL